MVVEKVAPPPEPPLVIEIAPSIFPEELEDGFPEDVAFKLLTLSKNIPFGEELDM